MAPLPSKSEKGAKIGWSLSLEKGGREKVASQGYRHAEALPGGVLNVNRDSKPAKKGQMYSIDSRLQFTFSPCPLKIIEVNSLGHFIRILNSSPYQQYDLSCYILWQLENNHPVSMYRFPINTVLPALQHITVWVSAAKVSHKPPIDLSWKGRMYFRSNPQCITVLSRPNGQPVTYYQAVHSLHPRTSDNTSISLRQEDVKEQMVEGYQSVIESPKATLYRTRCASAPPNLSMRTPQIVSCSVLTRPNTSLMPRPPSARMHGGCPAATVICYPSRLNRNSPHVRLLTQKSARSKHGFNFLSHMPFTCDLLRR
ncbi:lamin tail domain-containing protein 2 [Discoglossus pictus]